MSEIPETPTSIKPPSAPVTTEAENTFESVNKNGIGFIASPGILYRMFSAIAVPMKKEKKKEICFFPKIVIAKDANGIKMAQLGPSESLFTYSMFFNSYFKKHWGTGKFAIDSTWALDALDMLRDYNTIAVYYNPEENSVMFYAGEDDKIAYKTDNVENVESYYEESPVPFNEELFLPDLSVHGIEFVSKCETSDSAIKTILARATRFEMDEYPFTLRDDKITMGIGNLEMPDDGAFDKTIVTTAYQPPEEGFTVKIGEPFAEVIDKIANKIDNLNFAFGSDGAAVFMSFNIEIQDRVVAKLGYMFPSAIEDED